MTELEKLQQRVAIIETNASNDTEIRVEVREMTKELKEFNETMIDLHHSRDTHDEKLKDRKDAEIRQWAKIETMEAAIKDSEKDIEIARLLAEKPEAHIAPADPKNNNRVISKLLDIIKYLVIAMVGGAAAKGLF